MFCCSERFCEKIGWLVFRGNVVDFNLGIMNVVTDCVILNIDVFGFSIFGWIFRDVKRRLTI